MSKIHDESQLAQLESHIDSWLEAQLAENPMVAAVEKGVDGPRTWYVRLLGEAKEAFTIRFTLKQRTLAYETYVMPAPEENFAEFYRHLLERNLGLYGASFAIGEESAVFLQGALANDLVMIDDELDRVLGSLYAWVEQFFHPALRIGYASKFA